MRRAMKIGLQRKIDEKKDLHLPLKKEEEILQKAGMTAIPPSKEEKKKPKHIYQR